MSAVPPIESMVLDTAALCPPGMAPATTRCFNPALLADGDGWILAYRVVGADGRRRLAICRLDTAFGPRPGSVADLGDALRLPDGDYPAEAREWQADPRLYRRGDTLWLHWNSGWHSGPNYQFMAALDAHTLRPLGPARELALEHGRRPIEKNWTFFGDRLEHGIYAPDPFRLIERVEETENRLVYRLVPGTVETSAFARRYGSLRGGAPPVAVDNAFIVIGHAVARTPLGYRYVAAACRVSAHPPFDLLQGPRAPLLLDLPNGAGLAERGLNPAAGHIVYPTGAVRDGAGLLVSFGIDDRVAAIARVPLAHLETVLEPELCR